MATSRIFKEQLNLPYTFGMIMPGREYSGSDYRYGFQGQETDDEMLGGAVSYKYRVHDARIGRFLSVDPLTAKYPHYTPYSFSGNKVIRYVELEGLEESDPFESPEFIAAAITVNTAYDVFEAVGDGMLWALETFTTDDYTGNLIRRKLAKQGLEIDESITNEALTNMFEFKKNRGDVDVVFANGFWSSAANLGLGVAQLLAVAYPGSSPQTLFAKTGFKLTAVSASARYLVSRSGLMYGLGSKHGNRLSHVLAHTMKNSKVDLHGIFTVDNVFSFLDDAYDAIKAVEWKKTLKVGESETFGNMTRTLQEVTLKSGAKELRMSYVVKMNKVGVQGGKLGGGKVLNDLKIVVKNGTDEVITAYPQ